MEPEIELMHKVWDSLMFDVRRPTHLPQLNFDEIVSSIFASGPLYHYVIDFFDMHISNISSGFEAAHGIKPEQVHSINDILALIHAEDMNFVSQAEAKAFEFMHRSLGVEKFLTYKASYNFRFRAADGSYRLYNHQSLILTMDENNNFIKSLNIHTDISHITSKNNHTFSLIGLGGEPSYLDMEVFEGQPETPSKPLFDKRFTRREVEIIRLLAEGLDTKAIARKLFISPATAETHRKNILKKSGCENSVQLVAKSLSEGWV